MIEKGQDNVCIRAMVKSKKKDLNRRLTGTPPSTPPESEDEDDDGLNDYNVELTYGRICLIVHLLKKRPCLIALFQMEPSLI